MEAVSATDSLNAYVDFLNAGNDQMSMLKNDVYYYFESDMNDYSNLGSEPSFSCAFSIYDYANLKNQVLDPQGLTPKETMQLTSAVQDMITTIDSTEKLCKELSIYVTAQDYKEDDFAQGQTMITEIYANIETYYLYHEELLTYTDELFDIYDTWVPDPTDPSSVGLGYISDDLDFAETVFNVMEDSYSSSSFDKLAELQASYQNLDSNVSTHIDANAPAITDPYVLEQYNTFYDQMTITFLPTAKRSLRNFTDQNLEALYTDYYDILASYNSLVDDYNYYLDSMAEGY